MTKLKPRDSNTTKLRRQAQKIRFLENQIDVLLEKVDFLQESLAAERAAQQAAAQRRSRDAVARHSWNGRVT